MAGPDHFSQIDGKIVTAESHLNLAPDGTITGSPRREPWESEVIKVQAPAVVTAMSNRRIQRNPLPPHLGLTILYALVSHGSRRGLIDAATAVAQNT